VASTSQRRRDPEEKSQLRAHTALGNNTTPNTIERRYAPGVTWRLISQLIERSQDGHSVNLQVRRFQTTLLLQSYRLVSESEHASRVLRSRTVEHSQDRELPTGESQCDKTSEQPERLGSAGEQSELTITS
jgi:hypothetical protein